MKRPARFQTYGESGESAALTNSEISTKLVEAASLLADIEVGRPWSWWTGREVGHDGGRDPGMGLPRELLPEYRGQLAVATLTSALLSLDAFGTQVDCVRGGGAPSEIAKAYSTRRKRRDVVAWFLRAAAYSDMPEQAMLSLAGCRFITVGPNASPTPSTCLRCSGSAPCGSGMTVPLAPKVLGICHGCSKPILSGEGVTVDADGNHWHPDCRANPIPNRARAAGVSHQPATSDSPRGNLAPRLPYYLNESFGRAIARGALSIARRGAGLCIVCGAAERLEATHVERRTVRGAKMRTHTVAVPRHYCARHQRVPAALAVDVEFVYSTVRAAVADVEQ